MADKMDDNIMQDSPQRRACSRVSPGARYQGGFIITIELILIITILLIGSMVGIVAVRDALFKYYVSQQSQEAYVSDDAGVVLGKAVGFDEHEAPRIFYIDRTQEQNYRALIGIRDDRFTGREPLYYEGNSCQGDPCIKSPSNESADSSGTDGIAGTGAVGYIYGLQGTPTYAVGRAPTGLPGFLYRETPAQCAASPQDIGSRWLSQKVVAGEPCESYTFDVSSEDALLDCLVNPQLSCDCPSGYTAQTDILAQAEGAIGVSYDGLVSDLGLPGQTPPRPDIGQICCPDDTTLQNDGLVNTVAYYLVQETLALVSANLPAGLAQQYEDALALLVTPTALQCRVEIALKAAESVASPNDPALNALEGLTPPFRMNLPIDAGADSWQRTLPHGEGPVHFARP
ncbi:hypothetical protein [Marinobacterium rhizophilum]|uniref:Type IV pilus assembly protein PilW n=1 Tax=Marinobacterium rhizophilum TaxID=420402 RepID=A0ABY5HMB1_9GAMM|nr:hypothetical protein [Marinobacterium rhizophilum]UTW12051.1 hypothetical protein KDW95_22980 [Marinobacterium rhizophilum]